ncbi:MAG: 5-(carboxyamino)imidazole ribonucleotide synthase [Bacteroidia bacterium]|nr:5-(carboxyamino)imidazole ribonucleotide synthase [Bacteroidia bacterium]MCF8427475.1 5-(carboxyamino)imidazole ribonucleotide synthase [Bacteroidia bacterium]MCF8448131.1 5-(carboxyamino)imidazole ribonucleotide synthase [Bacteroidia bacterium]
MNPLKKRIGVLGGGQLGRMLIQESSRLNLHFNILEAEANCPCALLANQFIQGSLLDEAKIRDLAAISDVLTYEIEHVNTEALLKLEKEGHTIIPSPRILQMIQDKGLQKEFYLKNNIPSGKFFLVENKAEWSRLIPLLGSEKFVAKTRKGGYDGKGVAILNSQEIINNPDKIPFEGPCVLEEFIACQKELAVIVARDQDGNIASFPSIEMEFDPIANLVTLLISPARVGSIIEEKAEEIARNLVQALDGPGLFAVELFLDQAGTIFVNEVAPRPHNSGHHTIEACYTSQYEQLARILLGLPLGSTELVKAAGMVNLLGAPDFSGSYQLENLDAVSKMEGVYVHLYAKAESKPMRKMGHVSILANTIDEVIEKANYVRTHLKFVKD